MPPPTCVSCATGSRRAKLISCLHTLCMTCLEKHLQEDGSVKCPECAARTSLPIGLAPLLSLPYSYPQTTGDVAAESDFSQRLCDDCLEDESAVAICEECEICLCDLHTKGHRRSRVTHGHAVRLLSSGSPTAATAAAAGSQSLAAVSLCAIHPSQALTHFCTPCNQLLCESCQLSRRHSGDRHSVIGIQDAFQKTRDDVLANAAGCTADSDSGLAKSVEKVREAIQGVNDQTQSASEEAADFFAGLAKALQTRERHLLQQLDALRAQTLLPLEKQLARLQGGMARATQVHGILQSCRDGGDFLRMHTWLDGAVAAVRRAAEADAEPCVSSGILFAATDAAALLESVGQAGAVSDLRSCGALCRLSCSANPSVDADLDISIQQAETESGCRVELTSTQINAIPFLVEVTGPDGQDTECPMEQFRRPAPGQLLLRYRPPLSGWHVVSATVQGTYIRGSPARFFVRKRVAQVLRFDAGRCDPSMVITDDGATVQKRSHNSWKSVCVVAMPTVIAAEQPSSTQLRLRVDRTRFGNVCVAACSSSSPRLGHFHTDASEAFGWFGDGPGSAGYNSENLGQSWQAGDVVSLTLDRAKRTLTGVHERSGRSEVLNNVPSDCYWIVSLFFLDDQVTIMS